MDETSQTNIFFFRLADARPQNLCDKADSSEETQGYRCALSVSGGRLHTGRPQNLVPYKSQLVHLLISQRRPQRPLHPGFENRLWWCGETTADGATGILNQIESQSRPKDDRACGLANHQLTDRWGTFTRRVPWQGARIVSIGSIPHGTINPTAKLPTASQAVLVQSVQSTPAAQA